MPTEYAILLKVILIGQGSGLQTNINYYEVRFNKCFFKYDMMYNIILFSVWLLQQNLFFNTFFLKYVQQAKSNDKQ